MAHGWLIPQRTPGAAAVLRPATIRPTTGGLLYLRLARAGITTTTPIHAAFATASPGMSLISTGFVFWRFIVLDLRRSFASDHREQTDPRCPWINAADTISKLTGEFGLTPAARSRIFVNPPAEDRQAELWRILSKPRVKPAVQWV